VPSPQPTDRIVRVRLEAPLYTLLSARACREGRSLSNLIRLLLVTEVHYPMEGRIHIPPTPFKPIEMFKEVKP
jgi:hypothetical protein